MTRTFYGRAPRYAYYWGCSNCGRGALNAAAKYGAEFDGVIAGAPTFNMVGQVEGWTRAATLELPSAEALSAIHAAAVAKCDRLDGAADGIISHWACRFDPVTDVPAAARVTAAEADAVRTMMADLRQADGAIAYSGFGVSNLSGDWPRWQGGPGVATIRTFVVNDRSWSPAQVDPATLRPMIQAVLEDRYHFSASSAGLIDFIRAGTKVIVWNGSDDGQVSMRDTVRTWREVTDKAAVTARAHSRVYIPPGVGHCTGGSGADVFDLLTPLMEWVERGTAPGTPVASKVAPDGSVRFTRPLCEYPSYPRYRGTGDVNAATSFACVAP